MRKCYFILFLKSIGDISKFIEISGVIRNTQILLFRYSFQLAIIFSAILRSGSTARPYTKNICAAAADARFLFCAAVCTRSRKTARRRSITFTLQHYSITVYRERLAAAGRFVSIVSPSLLSRSSRCPPSLNAVNKQPQTNTVRGSFSVAFQYQ